MYNPLLKPTLGTPINKARARQLGVVGLWLFNEGGGDTVLDSSGNNPSGTFNGDTTWVSGDEDHAINFADDINNYIANVTTPRNYTALTFSARIRWTGGLNHNIIISGVEANTYLSVLNNSLFIKINLANYGSTVDLVSGDWYDVAGTWDGARVKLYLNGAIVLDEAETTNPPANQYFYIGGFAPSTGILGFVGDISRLSVYDRAHTASEIALLNREPFWMFGRDPIELWQITEVVGGLTVNVSDTIGVSDSVTAQLPEYIIPITDTANISDSVTAQLTQYPVNVSDSVDVSELTTAALEVAGELTADLSDAVNILDSVTIQLTQYNVDVSESLTTADSLTASRIGQDVDVTEDATITDNVTVQITTWNVSPQDNLAVSDNVTVELTIYNIDVSDNLSVVDSATVSIGGVSLEVSVSDSLSAVDAVSIDMVNVWTPVDDTVSIWDPQHIYPNFGEGVFGEDIFGKKGWAQVGTNTTEWT